jgi:preprotein translocase subunit YajC
MPSFILLLLILLVFASAFGFMIYSDFKKRAREKKRNQYHDRV